MTYLCGIDDGGCGDMAMLAYVVLDRAICEAADLRRQSNEILRKHGLAEFHGKDFRYDPARPSATEPYKQFLELVLGCVKGGMTGAGFELIDRKQDEGFHVAAGDLVKDAILSRGHPGGQVVDWITSKAGTIIWFCGHLGQLSPQGGLELMIDQALPIDLSEQDTAVYVQGSEVVGNLYYPFRARELLCVIGNSHLPGFAKRSGLQVEAFKFESVRYVRSHDDVLVQAADLIANFRTRLGPVAGARPAGYCE